MIKRSVGMIAAVGMMACGLGLVMAQQGPNRTSETVARPKKGAGSGDAVPEKTGDRIESVFKKKDGQADTPVFRTDTTTVQLDVAVLGPNGQFIPNIPGGNFRILEDNVPQKVTGFSLGEAPMTVALVVEFNNLYQQMWSETWAQTLEASYGFVSTLKKDDYLAIVAYDMKPEILSDFSTDRREAQAALQRMQIPAWSEGNLFDTLIEMTDRMSSLEGRKAIFVITSGIDTFSKATFDKTRKALQTNGVPIYALGLMQALRERADSFGYLSPIQRMDFLQADNQLRTFAKETGGQAYFPRFYGEFKGIFQGIAQAMRNQYMLTYQPSNQAKDGKYRKIKVELVNPATNEPLKINDEKNKAIKYQILTKPGYTAPREVE